MKRTIFVLAALCGVLLAAATYVALSRWYRGNATTRVSPDLVSLLPDGSPVVLYIDAAALRTTPFAAEIAALAPEVSQDPEYARFVQQTGFDYSRDLRRLAGAIWPRTSPPRALVIAEGQFDTRKIRAYALQSGKVEQIAGKEVLLVALHNPEKQIAITFLSPQRLALSDGVPMDDLLSGHTAPLADPEFSECVRSVSGDPLFAAARAEALPLDLLRSPEIEGQLKALLSSVKYLSLAGQSAGKNLELTLDARTDSASAALRISTIIEGLRFIGSAALADPRTRHHLRPPAALLLDTILRTAEITHGLNDAQVRLPITPEMLRSLSDSATIH
jgi:hypothetical protein